MPFKRAIRLAPLIRRHETNTLLQISGGLRRYTTPNTTPNHPAPHNHHHDKHLPSKSQAVPGIQKSSSPVPIPPGARHEPHEGTSALSAPYNPPGGGPGGGQGGNGFTFTNYPVLDAMITTAIGLGAVFVGGILYMDWYKKNVLDKIEEAFKPGYDPALELAKTHTTPGKSASRDHGDEFFDSDEPFLESVRRKEQDLINSIVHGDEAGHYFMLLGPKGSGKGTMVYEAMAEIQADGVSVCDAHPDLEVFRLRLGKALNYEFNEDTQTGLFQRRDPREGGAPLDIERALNKLEKVALKCAKQRGKPFVLIFNNIHFFPYDDEGKNMILQLQQKAEAWAASGILTVIFTSDDFWPFHVMRKTASRMHVLSVDDLPYSEAFKAITTTRLKSGRPPATREEYKKALELVGGRLSFLTKVAKAKDMVGMAEHLLAVEKGWILSRIGLIQDCDDDVMDEQKWSSCSWLLLQEFARMRREQEKERDEAIARGELKPEDVQELPLPSLSYYRCRQLMTRADFMEDLDKYNIIAIDVNLNVRPDSNLTLQAAMQVVEEEGFEDLLNNVRDRIDEIESLHRTRELTFKDVDKGDMIRVSVDKGGADMIWTLRGKGKAGDSEDDDDDD